MAGVDLYWSPLGASGHFVRLNGRVYEALTARLQRRPARDLYHSALQVELPEGAFVIEQAPVTTGADGARCCRRGRPSALAGQADFGSSATRSGSGAVATYRTSPRPSTAPRASATRSNWRHLLELVPRVPASVWGRDELGTGEMWNWNSVIAWVIACSGIDVQSIQPPQGGRAPGWRAGVAVSSAPAPTGDAPEAAGRYFLCGARS
jgi:hypothetical protein